MNENQASQPEAQQQAPEASVPTPKTTIVPLTDMSMMANVVLEWHANLLTFLDHMAAIPAGVEIEIADGKNEDGTPKLSKLVMNGDLMHGFKLGLFVAKSELQEPPFRSGSGKEAKEETASTEVTNG